MMVSVDIRWLRENKFRGIISLIQIILVSLPLLAQSMVEYGKASFYADRFQGRKTASGELYHVDSLTAAHKTLPFGTLAKITNQSNEMSVIVRINDRGPFVEGRIVDLSKRAMMSLEGIEKGVIDVKLEVISKLD